MSLLHKIVFSMLMRRKKDYNPHDPPDYRANQQRESRAKAQPIPRGIRCSPIRLGDAMGEMLVSSQNPKDKLVLYIHGGGFVGGSARARRMATLYIAKKMGYNVASIDYRLAPQHPFPAEPRDCFSTYRALAEQYGAENLALMGESAGGNLVLSVALQAQDHGIPLPACIVSVSPIVQYDQTFPSHRECRKTDCIISDLQQELRDVYLQTDDLSVICHPYAAPLYGDLSAFPATWLIASEAEVLRDDSVRFHEKLQAAGRESHLRLYPGLMHAFTVIPALPEAKAALRDVKDFLDRHLHTKNQRMEP